MPKHRKIDDPPPPGTVPFDDDQFSDERHAAAVQAAGTAPLAPRPARYAYVVTVTGPTGTGPAVAFSTLTAANKALAEQTKRPGTAGGIDVVRMFSTFAEWRRSNTVDGS